MDEMHVCRKRLDVHENDILCDVGGPCLLTVVCVTHAAGYCQFSIF